MYRCLHKKIFKIQRQMGGVKLSGRKYRLDFYSFFVIIMQENIHILTLALPINNYFHEVQLILYFSQFFSTL